MKFSQWHSIRWGRVFEGTRSLAARSVEMLLRRRWEKHTAHHWFQWPAPSPVFLWSSQHLQSSGLHHSMFPSLPAELELLLISFWEWCPSSRLSAKLLSRLNSASSVSPSLVCGGANSARDTRSAIRARIFTTIAVYGCMVCEQRHLCSRYKGRPSDQIACIQVHVSQYFYTIEPLLFFLKLNAVVHTLEGDHLDC